MSESCVARIVHATGRLSQEVETRFGLPGPELYEQACAAADKIIRAC
ncbi:MAG: hypothetical protein ABIT36_02150 [Steroidobacteraceae bacterium]